MGKVLDVLKGLPGLIPDDAYDDDYPDGVAGHVSAGARIDTSEDAVRTPFGVDHEFSGAHIDRDTGHRPEEVGEANNDARVHEAVAHAKKANERSHTSNVANEGRYGNHVFAAATPVRLVRRNENRKQVTLLCVSGGPCFVGNSTNIQVAPSPDTAYLPNGVQRVITHKDDIVVIGPAAAIVDFIEEVY
jgi:hypothetical protein